MIRAARALQGIMQTDSTLRPTLAVLHAGIVRAAFEMSESNQATATAQSWANLMLQPATVYEVDVGLAVPTRGSKPASTEVGAWVEVLTVKPAPHSRLPWNPTPGKRAGKRHRQGGRHASL